MRHAVLLLLALTLLACQADRQPPVWFVHATDPHLFDRADDEKPKEMTEEQKQEDKERRKFQEGMSQRTFADFLRTVGALSGTDAKPAFLVVTGDFGVDGVVGKTPASQEKLPERVLADLLAASPIQNVYFVPGNNDVVGESEQSKDLESMRELFGRVDRLLGGRVVLHDLTACYYLPGTSCEADVAGTEIRLIGFPTHSFKNSATAGSFKANQSIQEAHVDRLAALVERAKADGRKAMILTHIPELDDPYGQAQNSFAGKKKARPVFQPQWSAWNVSPKVYQRWKDIVDSRAVAGVLAGHFHDNHREIYYPPYQWSLAAGDRADPAKVLLAPPLGVRLQDTSPRQARGFALVRLEGDRVSRRMYWYHPARGIFQPDPARVRRGRGGWPGWDASVAWLWSLGGATAADNVLARAAIVAIAFLAAFLTMVQIWQIPPPDTRLTDPSRPAEPEKPAGGAAPLARGALPLPTGLLANNFASTVLSGLGGLALVSFLDAFWDQSKIQAKAYYLVLFVVFFLVFLVGSSLLRGLVEGLRSRVVIAKPSVTWPPQLIEKGSKLSAWQRFVRWSGYWRRRAWTWLLTFRTTVLTFADTFFNMVQGRNQLQTEVFSDAIVQLHWSIVWAADQVREQVDCAVCSALRAQGVPADDTEGRAVRVSISLLSADEMSAFYVSRESGSLGTPFDRFSVAWIAIYAGVARWVRMGKDSKEKDWDKVYARNTEAELYDNRGRSIPGEEGKVMLTRYFQIRESSDYKAFIVLPFPWAHRGRDVYHRRGGLHISFRNPEHLDFLWKGLEVKETPNYEKWQGLLTSPGRPKEPTQPDSAAGQIPGGLPEPPTEIQDLIEANTEVRTYLARLESYRSALVSERALMSRIAKQGKGLMKDAQALESEAQELAKRLCGEGGQRDGGDEPRLLDHELAAVLKESLAVLAELFSFFNDSIFAERIKPRIRL